MKSFVIVACLLHAAFAAPQLITFKDGKVGVNFFGYHAEAGLGGGQNSQNGLLGGLHASAGTPWGQNAAAGLGGNVNGRAAGVLYAGAQAIPDVGAGVVLGGDTSQGGYGASEAYVPGKTSRRSQVVKMVNTRQYDAPIESNDYYPATEGPSVIQKVRPVKKYRGDEAIVTVQHTHSHTHSHAHSHNHSHQPKHAFAHSHANEHSHTHTIRKSTEKRQLIAPDSFDGPAYESSAHSGNPNVVNNALQIPIGILQSLQTSLGAFH